MQLMPDTVRGLGVTDPHDPTQAIPAAARYLAQGLDKYGDPALALQYYHGGPDESGWGPKTRGYPNTVAKYYQQIRSQGAAAAVASPPVAAQEDANDAFSAAFGAPQAAKTAAVPSASPASPARPDDNDAFSAAFGKASTVGASGAAAPPPAVAGQAAAPQTELQKFQTENPDPIGAGVRRGVLDVVRSTIDPAAQYIENKLGVAPLEKSLGFTTAAEANASHAAADADLAKRATGPGGAVGRLGGNLLLAVPATESLMAGGGALLGAGARAAGAALPDLASAGQAVGNFITGNRLLSPLATGARLATTGAAGGALGGLATNATSDQPIAQQMRDNALLGAGVGVAAPAVARAAGNVITGLRNNLVTPLMATVSQGARETGAANNLLTQSSDPSAVYNRLTGIAANPASAELVPGSPATTYQATGDAGLGQAERGAARTYPEPFKAVEGQQNAARIDAVKGLAPDAADPQAVRDTVQQTLAQIDRQGDANISAAQQNAAQALAQAGGVLPRDAQGALLREQLEAAKGATKATEGSLWQAIDPDNTLTIGTGPTSAAAAKITNNIPTTAKPPQGEEAAIFDLAQGLPSTASFQDFGALRGRLLQAIRDERPNGQTPALRRMQMLRGAMDDTMSQGVADVANEQQQAVAAGVMAPQDTAMSRLQAEANNFVAAKRSQAGTGNGTGYTAGAGGRSTGVSGSNGAEISPVGGPGNIAGSPGVQSQSQPVAPPTFDTDAADRYRAAADATRNRAQTFNTGATGRVLQSGPQGTPYRVTDSNVPEQFMSSPEGVRSFLNAGGRPETLQDALVNDLRASASRPDGTIDPRKLTAWQAKRADALREFPALQQSVSNIGSAQSAVDNAVATKEANLADYQKSAVAPFLANEDPAKAVARVFSGDGTGKMRSLVLSLQSNPDAVDGLKRAVIDYMVGKGGQFVNSDGALNSASLRNFIRKNDGALGQLYSGDEMTALNNVSQDLSRSNLSITGTKIPGGSDTAQNAAAVGKFLGSMMGRRVAEGALHSGGLGALYLFGGWPLAIGGSVLSAARGVTQIGKAAINRTTAAALADPVYAGQIMRRVSPPALQNALTSGWIPTAAGAMNNLLSSRSAPVANQLTGQ